MKNNLYDTYLSTHFESFHDAKDFIFSNRFFDANFKSFLPHNKNSKILDIGCGTGHFLHYLTSLKYVNYIGVDISKEQIEFCKKYITKKVVLIDDLGEYLEKNRNAFDFILMNDVIEHLPKEDIISILTFLFSSLKPGGNVLIKTANLKHRWGSAVRYMDFTHTVGFTEESIRQVMRLAGFRKIFVYKEVHPIHDIKSLVRVVLKNIFEFFYRVEYLASFGSLNPIVTNMFIALGQK